MTGIKSLTMAAALAILVPTAYAATEHGGTAMPMMQMQERMQQMQKLMDRIRTTKNPRERRKLMQEHMRDMRRAMSMMGGGKGGMMMGGGMMGSGKGGMMGGANGRPMSPERMQGMMQKMEDRQQMMQMMMNQMMEHMSAQSGGK